MPITTASEIRLAPSVLAFSQTNTELGQSVARLSAGHRYFSTGEDVASISAAAGIQAQSSTLRSTQTNGAKATSLLQIATDGLSQIRAALDTLATLTETANASGVTDRQRATLDTQFQFTLQSIDDIIALNTFGGQALFDGSFAGSAAPEIITGDAAGDTLSLSLPDLTSGTLFAATPSLATAATASAAETPVTDASDTVDAAIALVSAYETRLTLIDQAVEKRLYGNGTATESLLATDPEAETRARDRLAQRQDIAATILAQTLQFNSGLLELVMRRD